MWLKALLTSAALLWATAAHADNFVMRDAVGNFVTFPCTIADGVCTPTVDGGGGGGGAVTLAASAVAAGAYVAGSVLDGAMVTIGALADAACATDNGTCSLQALVKRTNQRLTTLIGSGIGSTAAAVPSTATYLGAGSDGGLAAGTASLTGLITCNNSVAISTSSSGNTELVALTAGETIYVCGYELMAAGTVNVQFITGTGTACATNEFDETGLYPLVANAGLVSRSPFWSGMAGAAGDAFCIELSTTVATTGVLYYTKF